MNNANGVDVIAGLVAVTEIGLGDGKAEIILFETPEHFRNFFNEVSPVAIAACRPENRREGARNYCSIGISRCDRSLQCIIHESLHAAHMYFSDLPKEFAHEEAIARWTARLSVGIMKFCLDYWPDLLEAAFNCDEITLAQRASTLAPSRKLNSPASDSAVVQYSAS